MSFAADSPVPATDRTLLFRMSRRSTPSELIRARGQAVADLAFGDLRRTAMTMLLAWLALAEVLHSPAFSLPALVLTFAVACHRLYLMIERDFVRRSAIRRRLEVRRANVLRRLRSSAFAL